MTYISHFTYRNYLNLVIETSHTDGILFDDVNITTTMSEEGISLGDEITTTCWVM